VADELSALAEVAADAADRVLLRTVQTMHGAIARRAFGGAGLAARPAQITHDVIAGAVYAGLRAVLRGGGRVTALTLRHAASGRDRPVLSSTRLGRSIVSAVNGVSGDRVAAMRNDLSVQMAVRHLGHDVPPTHDAIRAAFPQAAPDVVILLHGLCENEESWRSSLLRRLRRECALTVVPIRYNSGLHIAANGAELALLLERMTAAWPVHLSSIALVGHSMGGLVIRSAAHRGLRDRYVWPKLTRHIVTLGTPHHGSFVEQGAHRAAGALRRLPEARALADIIDLRSDGIRDLRHGYITAEEWQHDRPTSQPVHIPGCTTTFIAATVTRSPRHVVGRAVGDLLVRVDSASGRHRDRVIRIERGGSVELGGLHHFDLLGHPQVARLLCELLAKAEPRRRPAGGEASSLPAPAATGDDQSLFLTSSSRP
jgi:triacylglycerol lipase